MSARSATISLDGVRGFLFGLTRGRRSRSAHGLKPLPEDFAPQAPVRGAWKPEDSELPWLTRLVVAPDLSEIVQGGAWADETKHPRVKAAAEEAARTGAPADAQEVLLGLVKDASPVAAAAGYGRWGKAMRKWHDHWLRSIEDDLKLYAENPEFLRR